MKKIVLVLIFSVSACFAQDDVSIMDLKETVYYLMIDVKELVDKKNTSITSLKIEIEKLKKENQDLHKKNILSNYEVSNKLMKYKNKH